MPTTSHARRIAGPDAGRSFDLRTTDAVVASLASAQQGHVGRGQLAAAGMPAHVIDARVRSGHLEVVHAGVYRVGGAPATLRGRQWAAVLACGDRAVLGFGTAAQLRGYLLDERRIEVVVPPDAVRAHAGLHVRRCLLPREELDVVEGLPVTSWSRTVLDVAAVKGDGTTMRVVDRSIQLREFDRTELDDCLRRHPRRHGRRRLLRVLALLPEDGSHARSVLEQDLLHLLWSSGLPRPQVDVPVGPYVVDLLWPAQRLVVECDGLLWHGGPLARRQDAVRQRELERRGLGVERVTWADVHARPEATLGRIATALTQRSKDRQA